MTNGSRATFDNLWVIAQKNAELQEKRESLTTGQAIQLRDLLKDNDFFDICMTGIEEEEAITGQTDEELLQIFLNRMLSRNSTERPLFITHSKEEIIKIFQEGFLVRE